MPVILVAIGCSQLKEIKAKTRQYKQVVIGSMDGQRLNTLQPTSNGPIIVYLYETG